MNPFRVLLVDDDTFFLKVYGDFLTSRGFTVETANGGEQALGYYQGGRYELVIVDLIMPGLSGIELIERMRSIKPAQDVVVVTSSDDVRTAVRAMQLGVYDYLVKPIERQELLLVIDRLQERTTLYDEHARLLHENIQHVEMQSIFHRALHVLGSLELDHVCDRLLATLSEICGAQGAALYLQRPSSTGLALHGYRGLIDSVHLPMSWDPASSKVGTDVGRGLSVLVGKDLDADERHPSPAPTMLCPLSREGRLLGVVCLVDKLGGGFIAEDVTKARWVAECGALAVSHAQRVQSLERVGLRDPSTTAYSMTYFVDYLGREFHKARRYQRSFALLHISIDHMDALQQALRKDLLQETLRQLVVALTSVLRDVDVLAQVQEDEMYLLLPETDLLGGLALARAARDSIYKTPFLAQINREHPLAVSFAPAAFPRDGDDVDQLFAACHRRLGEARRSLFRRLHLKDVSFWEAVQLLIGEGEDKQKTHAGMEDSSGLSRHHLFSHDLVTAVRQEVFAEAVRGGRSRGWLFLGGSWTGRSVDDVNNLLAELERAQSWDLRIYMLGQDHPDRLTNSSQATSVHVEGDAFKKHEILLHLTEDVAYGLLARRDHHEQLWGFHTANWTLVEGLIDKIQEFYHLQKGAS